MINFMLYVHGGWLLDFMHRKQVYLYPVDKKRVGLVYAMPQVVESHCEIDFSLEIETITIDWLIKAMCFLVDKRPQKYKSTLYKSTLILTRS